MAQPAFLVKTHRHEYVQTSKVHCSLEEETRPDHELGGFLVVKGTGKFHRDFFRLMVPTVKSLARSQWGGTPPNVYQRVKRSGAGVKAVIRRLRPAEARQLDEIDAQIEDLVARTRDLRDQRATFVGQAWTKGHVVRLGEVEPMGPGQPTELQEPDV
jgi:hypothetical protein